MSDCCTCGHNIDDHGHDPVYVGSSECQHKDCDCIAFEEAEDPEPSQ